jgi:hypothetical protein
MIKQIIKYLKQKSPKREKLAERHGMAHEMWL